MKYEREQTMKEQKLIISAALVLLFGAAASLAQAGNSLYNVPTGSKVIFTQDFVIPPNEKEVNIGKFSHGGMVTECTLYMKTYDNSIRKIPKNTTFKVLDTRYEFNKRVDLLIESQSLKAVGCTTIRPLSDPMQYLSEDDTAETRISEAQRALVGKVRLEINKEPKLIID